jgi:pSer/pThr/pTyr-binding forkhead associated (FHA) protein
MSQAQAGSSIEASPKTETVVLGSSPRFVGVLRLAKGVMPLGPVTIERDEIVIGRQETVAVPLDDDRVSRRHARVRRDGDDFVLEDLDSSNGTYVDGVPVVECVLRTGDWIQIGRNLFRFELQLGAESRHEDLTTWLE